MFYFYVLLAIIAGVSVVISRIYNSRIAEEIGTLPRNIYKLCNWISYSLLTLYNKQRIYEYIEMITI